MEERLKADTTRLVEAEGNNVKMMWKQATTKERFESKGQEMILGSLSTTPLYLLLFFIEVFMFYGLFPNYYNSIFICLTQQFPLSSLSLSTLPPILWFSHSAWLSLLIGTRWSASKHMETTGLRQIPREHYHSTCTAWQAPDEADWTQSFIPALVWWSSLIRSHFSNLLDGSRRFQLHQISPHTSSAHCS